MRKKITVYTDGACKGNPGSGGWAAIILDNGKETVLRGGMELTTNNRMELTAVIAAVEYLDTPCDITICCDSTYVMMSKARWEAWDKKPSLPNRDLWERLINAGKKGRHLIFYKHVDGHTGVVLNERCDKIAREQATKYWRYGND